MPQSFAYVTVLYGNTDYFLGALALGESILRNGSKHDRVLLHTDDVPAEQLQFLSTVWNVLMRVDYVYADPSLIRDYENSRFKEVFTKLQCLSLVQYSKILLLDSDMLLLRNIDELFELTPPAAYTRTQPYEMGEVVPASEFTTNDGRPNPRINAGLMLLQPDAALWRWILSDITSRKPREPFPDPEQAYIGMLFSGFWRYIPVRYNFQFGLKNNPGLKKLYTGVPMSDLANLHFSAPTKPWHLLRPKPLAHVLEIQRRYKEYVDAWMLAYDSARTRVLNAAISGARTKTQKSKEKKDGGINTSTKHPHTRSHARSR